MDLLFIFKNEKMNFRVTFLALLLCFTATFLSAQTYADFIAEGDRFYDQEKYVESLVSYERAFALKDAKPEAGDFYNAACAAALASEKDKAFQFLSRSIDEGWTSMRWMMTDGDLVSLREEPQWNETIERMKKIRAEIEKTWNRELRNELMEIAEKDQRHRRQMREVSDKYGWNSSQMDSLWAMQTPLDSLNTIRILEIIEQHGYPGKTLVGDQAGTAFMVIQHADIEIQEKYLPVLTAAAEQDELSYRSLALLIDRVLMRQNKPQIYGSQLQRNSETGEYEFYFIEDEKNVNERRKEVGLEPLEDYAKRFGLEYSVPKK